MGKRKRKGPIAKGGQAKRQPSDGDGRKPSKTANKGKKGRWKRQRFWIQDCKEVKPGRGKIAGGVGLIISRVELTDEHHMNPAPPPTASPATTAEDHAERNDQPLSSEKTCDDNHSPSAAIEGDADEVSTDETTKQSNKTLDGTTWCKTGATAPDTRGGDLETEGKKARASISPLADEAEKKSSPEEKQGEGPGTASEVSRGNRIEASIPAKCCGNHEDASLPVSGSERSAETSVAKVDNQQSFICVRLAPSAKTKNQLPQKFQKDFVNLPHGDCGDGIVNPHPNSVVGDKYWAQRHRLFSRFDEGVQLDNESWYSVTPEAIADHVAKKVVELSSTSGTLTPDGATGIVVLDPFCGCGGNAIAFGKRPASEISMVVCVDIDREKLRKLANNAHVYGVPPNRVRLINADAMEVLTECYRDGELVSRPAQNQTEEGGRSNEVHLGYTIGGLDLLPQRINVVFLSPPWGGSDYGRAGKQGFNLSCIKVQTKFCPVSDASNEKSDVSADSQLSKGSAEAVVSDGVRLLKAAANAAKGQCVVYFLPRNINGISVGRAAQAAGYTGNLEMEQNILNSKLKTVTVYLGWDRSGLLSTKGCNKDEKTSFA